MKKKRIMPIILIALLVIVIGVIVLINMGGEKRAQRKLNTVADKFYSYYYDDNSDKKDKEVIKEFLSNYVDTGITINLKNLKLYMDTKKIENYGALNKCDEEKTKVIITPFSPYGKKDKTITTILDCDF